MAVKEARDQPDRRERQAHAAVSDNELKAAAYFAVDVASEGSVRGRNVAYEISFAGYMHQEGETSRRAPIEAGSFRAGQLAPIYNSGYSIGTLQPPSVGCQSHVAPLSEPAGVSQGIEEVNEKEPAALLSNGLPLTAFVGMSRNHSDLIGSGQNMNRMLSFPVVLFALVLSSFGCAKPVSQAASPAFLPVEAAVDAKPNVTAPVPFAGSWQSCAGAESPEQCSRYLLVQRGKRICGTWSYFASGDSYEGRVMAEAISPVEARRTRICGRPGSETRTECEAGWDTIDRPLRLCGGKLGDLDSKDGRCFADFERVERPDPSLEDLAAQAWLEACLSRKEEKSK